MEEAFVTCPHCWENISVLVDVSVNGKHCYVEDCEVCCNPLDFRIHVGDFQVVAIEASIAQ